MKWLLLLALVGCHSSGLVRGATLSRSETTGPQSLVLEPYPGGLRAKLHTRVPPAKLQFSAQRTGERVRIEMAIGRYSAKCIREVDVVIDLGPLPPGSYEVSIDDTVAHATVSDAGAAPVAVATGATVRASCS